MIGLRASFRSHLCIRRFHKGGKSTAEKSSVRTNTSSLNRSGILNHQNELFTTYKSEIFAANVPRIEKIEVQYKGRNIADDGVLLMNKNLSTPHQCAMHVSKNIADNSVLALVKKSQVPEHEDGTVVAVKDTSDDTDEPSSEITVVERPGARWVPWDMHRPLEYDCEVKLLGFMMNQASQWEMEQVNRAYWKACALLLGAVAQEAFEDNLTVKLAHLPKITEECGAFCYDLELDQSLIDGDGSPLWQGDKAALVSLTKTARHILSQNLQFDRLVVHKETAQEIFQNNEHQLKRIEEESFPSTPLNKVPLYRFGRYIDICEGPLIPNTSLMYQYVVTAVHQLRSAEGSGSGTCLWRFQGLSLPKKLQVHHAVWSMLEHRARKLVKKDFPYSILESNVQHIEEPLHKYSSIENETKKYNHSTGQWLEDAWKSSDKKLDVTT